MKIGQAKLIGYANGGEENPDGTEMDYCDEICSVVVNGETVVASAKWLDYYGLIPNPLRPYRELVELGIPLNQLRG